MENFRDEAADAWISIAKALSQVTMFALSTVTVGLVMYLTLAELDATEDRDSRRPKRETYSFSSQQSKTKTNTDDDAAFHNEPNSGFHNILPNYRTPAKYCYQCAYSPPKAYSNKEKQSSASKAGVQENYKTGSNGLIRGREGVHGGKPTRSGGWDKCVGPFNEVLAAEYGVDVWQCHSNCYTRRDPNGDIFRGCFKGEYGVDPSRSGCHHQSGSIYCFCDQDRCNNIAVPTYNVS